VAGPLDPKTLYSADAIKAFAEEKDVVIVGFLKIHDVEQRRRIWTCLEHTMVNHINLMMDRQLNQLIMCSLYITYVRIESYT